VLYVLSPVALWQLARERRTVAAASAIRRHVFFAAASIPYAFFALLSAVS